MTNAQEVDPSASAEVALAEAKGEPKAGSEADLKEEPRPKKEADFSEIKLSAISEEEEQVEESEQRREAPPPRVAPPQQVVEIRAPQGEDMKSTTSIRGTEGKVGKMRHIVALLALSSIILANTNRQAFNQALVYMIRAPKAATLNAPLVELAETQESKLNEPMVTMNATSGQPPPVDYDLDDRYDWTSEQKSLLQSAFSYGYMPFMIAGGRMSELYGAKWVVFLSGFGSAICSILTPLLADWSLALLVASRVLMGVCQTGVSPALYALLTRWLPPEESSIYLPMIKTGVMFGFMAGSLINSFLSWRWTFYVVGLVGLIWSFMWTILVSSTPQEHKFISQKEKDYLRVCLNHHHHQVVKSSKSSNKNQNQNKQKAAPWLSIISNPVVLAFMFTKLTVKLSTDAQSMQLPMYLDNVFHVSKQINGLLNAVNFAIQAICTGFVAYLCKEMIANSTFGLTKTGVRRLSQGINNFGMALGYILITFNMGSFWVVSCAVIGLALCSIFGAGGEAVLPIDLTNEYSASIMAIANTVANLSGIVLPPMVSFLLADDVSDPTHWAYVWWFVAAVMITGGFAFCFFVEAEIQDFGENKLVLCDNCKQIIVAPSDFKQQQVTAIELTPISTT